MILPVRDTSSPGHVTVDIDSVSVEIDTDLSVVDWEQPERFARLNRDYGFWGLVLLETIVRQADWATSEVGSVV